MHWQFAAMVLYKIQIKPGDCFIQFAGTSVQLALLKDDVIILGLYQEIKI
jgi:hypothetical protein